MATKLQRLLEKEAQLKAQIQLAKAAERTLEKKRDTRRKILIGAAVMARVNGGEWPEADLRMMMDGFLSRPNERELFGLDAAEGDQAGKKATQKAKKTAQGKTLSTKQQTHNKLPESAAGSGFDDDQFDL